MNSRATSTDPGTKSAAEIEREVRQSRAEVEETLDQIQERLSPGQLFDQAVTYLRDGGGGDFTRNLGTSIRDNPMPVALVALGVGWMMFSGQRSADHGERAARGHWDEDLDALDEPYGGLSDERGPYLATDTDPEDGGYGAYSAGSYGGGADESGSLVDDLKDRGRAAGDKLGELGDQAREQARHLGERARDVSEQARARVERARAGVADRAYEARDRARRQGSRARQSVIRSFQDQPLVLGAIGVAIGAALGAALPPTETEDRLMGETRDDALRRAAKAGRAQAEKVRASADAAVSAVREEVQQGTTQERDDQAGQPATGFDRPGGSPVVG